MTSITSTRVINAAVIAEAHQLYCDLTAQNLRLAFDRERAWYELLHNGYTLDDVRRVIAYLQKEIRNQRRNVGALKLRNFLQLDLFEEDLNISRVRLKAIPRPQPPPVQSPLPNQPRPNSAELELKRQDMARRLADLRKQL